MTTPVRLRLSREKGFCLQHESRRRNGLAAVSVARRGGKNENEFSNPFRIIPAAHGFVLENDPADAGAPMRTWYDTKAKAAARAVQLYREEVNKPGNEMFRQRVRIVFAQANPACWCRAKDACHADVILELLK